MQSSLINFAYLSLVLALSVAPALSKEAELKPFLDKRITNTTACSELIGARDAGKEKFLTRGGSGNFFDYYFSDNKTSKALNAGRARILCDSGHLDEALAEWNMAIGGLTTDTATTRTLPADTPLTKTLHVDSSDGDQCPNPQWLLGRADVNVKLGRKEAAISDIERALREKVPSEPTKFQAALLQLEMGNAACAESILSESILPESRTVQPSFRPYFFYLLALTQQKQGQNEKAIANFKEAASIFVADDRMTPAQACLDACASVYASGKRHRPLKVSDLTPPSADYENIEKLLRALASRNDVFSSEVLKDLSGAKAFVRSTVTPDDGVFKAISILSIDALKSGGKKIEIFIDPTQCSINKSALNGLLRRKNTTESFSGEDAYMVPAGTLVLSASVGGFHSIYRVELYSKDPARSKKKDALAILLAKTKTLDCKLFKGRADDKIVVALKREENSPLSEHTIQQFLRRMVYRGLSGVPPKVVSQLLSTQPTNTKILAYQADNYFRERKFDKALAIIDLAIRYQEDPAFEKAVRDANTNNGTQQWVTFGWPDSSEGDALKMKKAAYLLEMRKFSAAFDVCEQVASPKSWGDYYLLRGRSELGMKRFPEAVSDLTQASKHFYDECRIDKRDETEKLLKSVSASISQRPR